MKKFIGWICILAPLATIFACAVASIGWVQAILALFGAVSLTGLVALGSYLITY